MERQIFWPVLTQAGYDPKKADIRLNWGTHEAPEIKTEDILKAAELGFIQSHLDLRLSDQIRSEVLK